MPLYENRILRLTKDGITNIGEIKLNYNISQQIKRKLKCLQGEVTQKMVNNYGTKMKSTNFHI